MENTHWKHRQGERERERERERKRAVTKGSRARGTRVHDGEEELSGELRSERPMGRMEWVHQTNGKDRVGSPDQ